MSKAKSASPIVVLHVEDNENDAVLVRQALAAMDASVQCHLVQDGFAALEFVRKKTPRPHLIILDMHLPGKSGLEVLAELKNDSEHMDIPVVIFSSSASKRDIRAAYCAHANSYIRKPEEMDEFFEVIAGVERYWARTVLLPLSN
jgi:two-component system, chemotaxis family, response regulator Rcp1